MKLINTVSMLAISDRPSKYESYGRRLKHCSLIVRHTYGQQSFSSPFCQLMTLAGVERLQRRLLEMPSPFHTGHHLRVRLTTLHDEILHVKCDSPPPSLLTTCFLPKHLSTGAGSSIAICFWSSVQNGACKCSGPDSNTASTYNVKSNPFLKM